MEIKKVTKAPHGVAMFVVLGVILVCSLLGILVLQLANHDNLLAGSLVNIKSQRMAAIASLNLAVGRLEERPNQAVNVINDFQADSTKRWLDFSGDSVIVTNVEPNWCSINGSDSSAVKVRILGMSNLKNTSSTVDVLLEGRGRGRNGDVFKVNAIYRIHGLNFQNYVNTNGTSNAFLAAGGVSQLQIGDSINGPVYLGGTGISTFDATNASSNITKLRVQGTLLNRNKIHVSGNVLIGGELQNIANSSLSTDSNLVIKGGVELNGSVAAGGSIYIYGSPVVVGAAGATSMTAGKYLRVVDAPFLLFYTSVLNVGSSSQAGVAYFAMGSYLDAATTSLIYGPLYTGVLPDAYSYGGSMIPSSPLGSYLGGSLTVNGDLSYFNSGAGTLRSLEVVSTNGSKSVLVKGNASFAGGLRTGKAFIPTFTVNGKTYLAQGIDSLDNGASSYAAITFGDSVLSKNINSVKGQSNVTGQKVTFQKNLSLNGYLSKVFANANGEYVGATWTYDGWTNGYYTYGWHWVDSKEITQSFPTQSGCLAFADGQTNMKPGAGCTRQGGDYFASSWKFTNASNWWTYTKSPTLNNFSVSSSSIAGTNIAVSRPIDDAPPSWVTDATSVNLAFPTLVPDPTNTTAQGSLGFTAADTLLAQADNPASQVDTTQFLDAAYSWGNILGRYINGADKGACPDLAMNADWGTELHLFPSAKALQCLYDNEKAHGKLWNDEYLVLHFTSGDAWTNYLSGVSLGVIPSGVKILYYFSAGSINGLNGGTTAAGVNCGQNVTWYSGAPGSSQVLISNANMTNFSLGGTYYGFIYFNYAGSIQTNQLCDVKIVGAWENASGAGRVSFPQSGGKLNIDYSSNLAKGVFSDIALSFSTSKSATTGKVAIKFSGDAGNTDPLAVHKQVNLQDGWVQFERLGEFR